MTGYVADLSWKSGARAIEKLDRLRSTLAILSMNRLRSTMAVNVLMLKKNHHSVCPPRPIHQKVKWLPGHAQAQDVVLLLLLYLVPSAVVSNRHIEAQWAKRNCQECWSIQVLTLQWHCTYSRLQWNQVYLSTQLSLIVWLLNSSETTCFDLFL